MLIINISYIWLFVHNSIVRFTYEVICYHQHFPGLLFKNRPFPCRSKYHDADVFLSEC